jgi:hypothetical protein
MNDRATPTPSPPPRKPSRGRYQPLHSIRVVERQEETPVFEIDEEERLEEMATVGRGPRRLAAAARLAAKTRRAVRQTRRAALDPLPAAQPDSGSQSAPIVESRAAKPPAAKPTAAKPTAARPAARPAKPTAAEPTAVRPAARPAKPTTVEPTAVRPAARPAKPTTVEPTAARPAARPANSTAAEPTAARPAARPGNPTAAEPTAARPAARPAKPKTARRTAIAKPKAPAPAPPAEPRLQLPAASQETRALTPARLRRLRSANQARVLNAPVDPVQVVADEQAWNRWVSAEVALGQHDGMARLDEERRSSMQLARRPVQRPAAAAKQWRQRASAALDRLAEREVERGARLERAIVPRIFEARGRPGRRDSDSKPS